jgi:hypothetical protein
LTIAVVQKVCDGCTTIKTTIKTTINKQASKGHGQRHETMGKLLIFLQEAKWRLHHKGFGIAGELTLCTASSSGLGQQGHKTSLASCVV